MGGDVVDRARLDLAQLAQIQEVARQTVGVNEASHSYGIGSQLLRRGLDWAEANGYRQAYDSVPTTYGRAIEFLDAHDWETGAIRRDHYTIGDEYIDEAMMAYTF